MKMRTAYLKVNDMNQAVTFWSALLQTEPHKKSPYWSEFQCENINFGLLWTEGFAVAKNQSNFVPVFEVSQDQLDPLKTRALQSGAQIIVDILEHPDKMSYVLSDPFGNEFEITRHRP